MQKITIDRSKWIRGEGATPSRLLRESDGKMCCLGQVLLALGKTEEDIRNVASPAAMARSPVDDEDSITACKPPGTGTVLVVPNNSGCMCCPAVTNSELASLAMDINDTKDTTDAEKEEALSRAFAKKDIELVFVDGAG